jgi:hypothetical protein
MMMFPVSGFLGHSEPRDSTSRIYRSYHSHERDGIPLFIRLVSPPKMQSCVLRFQQDPWVDRHVGDIAGFRDS